MRYMLFSGAIFYPERGVDNLIGHFDTVEAALDRLMEDREGDEGLEWFQIYDVEERRIVSQGNVD